jgi:hypothetical protein
LKLPKEPKAPQQQTLHRFNNMTPVEWALIPLLLVGAVWLVWAGVRGECHGCGKKCDKKK